MSSPEASAPTPTPQQRVRRGAALLVGVVVYAVLVAIGSASFYWTPLILGLAYLAGAIAGGRKGGWWATAVALIGWGGATVLITPATIGVIDADPGPAYLVGGGLALIAVPLLARAGIRASALGVGGTLVVGGLLLGFEPQVNLFVKPWFYVALIGAVAVLNLALGLSGRDAPDAGRAAAPTAS